MFRHTGKITAFALSAALLCSGVSMDVQAAQGISSVLPSGGINIALDNGTGLESLQDQTGKNIQLETVVNARQVDEAKAAGGMMPLPRRWLRRRPRRRRCSRTW